MFGKSKDNGSSARVDRAMADQRKAADRAVREAATRQRQANPKCRADKSVLRDKTTKRR